MLEVRRITCSFDQGQVLHGIDLTVERGEILCPLGPSGCGKTTLLRIIAGLQRPDGGDVLLDGHSILDVPIHKRDFGLMFQEYALFPHMNVAQNISFGLRMRGMPNSQRQQRLQEILTLVGLIGFEQRDMTELSGGERQRVALGRSLAPNPRLLMLDEPLGSLDATLRDQLVVELHAIIKRAGLAAIYVTHDQHEAFAVADRIAIMRAGRIEQIGTPESLYRRPQTAFVAQFMGLRNILPVLSHTDTTARTPIGDFAVPDQPDAILLHPDGLSLAARNAPGALAGCVSNRVFRGDVYSLEIVIGGSESTVLTLKLPAWENAAPDIGDTILIQIRPESIIPLTSDE